MTFLIDFIIAFTVASILIPVVLRIAHTRRLFDRKEEHKTHAGDIPRLGGIGIAAGFLTALISAILVARVQHGPYFPGARFWGLLSAGIGFHGLGLVDDFRNLPGRAKLFVQILLAAAVVACGYYFRTVEIPGILSRTELGVFGPLITVVWIVGVSNAYNLLDGMDGMAGGVAFIAFGVWAAFYLKDGQYLPTLLAVAGAGSVLGFLFYNFPPAAIFMGDSGSLFLGFLSAVLPLLGTEQGSGDLALISAITISLLPILDTITAILRRWKNKVSFFTADKFHLHYKLQNLGLTTRQILAYTYSTCAILGTAVLAGAYVDRRIGGYLMMGSWALGIAFFIVLHFLKERNIRIGNGGLRPKSKHGSK